MYLNFIKIGSNLNHVTTPLSKRSWYGLLTNYVDKILAFFDQPGYNQADYNCCLVSIIRIFLSQNSKKSGNCSLDQL